MITQAEPLCRWCGCVITNSKKNQKFCSSNHRYLFHKHQLIHPAKLEEKVREIVTGIVGDIVRKELRKTNDR